MSIVMGVDQHRAQITAEWIDVASGEISRARVRPADRAGVRRFLERFAGQQLEVALEATTGWRFLVEELRAVGALVHLAEPAETAALRGNKQRAKSDRADARHHRELLLAGRLPESWIPPDHILDLRAQVRLRHTLIEQHCEWQQKIQAVLYHHGCPHRRQLDAAVERLAVDQLEVEVSCTLEDRLVSGLSGDHWKERHLDAVNHAGGHQCPVHRQAAVRAQRHLGLLLEPGDDVDGITADDGRVRPVQGSFQCGRHHRCRHAPHPGDPCVMHLGLLGARGQHPRERPIRIGPEDHPLLLTV
jgi:Transposase